MAEPKPVRAWAVVKDGGDLDGRFVYAYRDDAEFSAFLFDDADRPKDRVIPVEIRPLADTEREER